MNNEQDPEQVEPDIEAPDTLEINDSKSTYTLNKLDQELADQYGWTPQQAEESRLYL